MRGPGEAAQRSESAERTEDGEGDDQDREGRRRRAPMYERVGPDEAQLARIDSIVSLHGRRMRDLHAEFRRSYDPRYRQLVLETREAIKGVLTPEQAGEYQQLLDEYDARRAERANRDGNGSRDGRPNG